MEQVSIIPFYKQREQAQVVAPVTFRRVLSEHGFTVTQTRPVYTDVEVLQQQWLVCPDGAIYPDHTFYRLFGTTGFRKLFRFALIHVPCTRATLESFCPNELHLTRWLSFLQDQKWFHWDGRWLDQGPYQLHITNIGRTLEWYIAEWFRLTQSSDHLVPVRHGVSLKELPLPGDLDVVACLDEDMLIMVECKSGNEVDQGHYLRFFQRVQAFQPTLAILLLDTSAPFSHERLSVINTALHTLGKPPILGDKGFYRGPMNVYIVNVEHNITTSLNDVLSYHRWRISFA